MSNPELSGFVPDFFIVGAPKCGTTSLFSSLSTHPGIAMSTLKEPFFWSPDLTSRGMIKEETAYRALWDHAEPGALKGEASADYFLSEVAIPSIVKARPDAKLILLLRNPIDMAASFHAEMVQSFQEPVNDFKKAWSLQPVRRKFARLGPDTIEPRKLQYAWICALGDHLERFIRDTRAERRLILLFDDLARTPRSVYLQVLAFLKLPDDGRNSFPRLNSNRKLRSARLAAFHRSIPRYLGPVYAPARALAARLRISPSAVLNGFNIREAPRAPLDPAFRTELLAVFMPQIEKIETLLQVDLSHWKA